MPLSFSSGSALPVVGSPAYNAAASSGVTGTGTYDANTGTLSQGGKTLYAPPVNPVQQTTTAYRQQTAANVNDFNNKVLPAATAGSAAPTTGAKVTINKGDTLSGLAARYGVTVQDFINANKGNAAALPDPSNPNLILAGGSLNIPSTPAAPATGQGAGKTGPGSTGTGTGTGTGGDGTQTGGGSGDGGTGNGADTGSTSYDDGTEKVTGNESIDKQISKVKSDAQDQIDQINSTLQKLLSSSDGATSSLIAQLQANYQSLKANLDDKLKNQEGWINQSNERNGRARYAPILAQGLISSAEVQEAMKLNDAFNKMSLAVSKAQQAQDNNDTKLFNQAYSEIKGIKSDMTTSIGKLYTLSSANLRAQQSQDRENRLADQQTFNQNLQTSKRSAPGLAKEMEGMASDADKTSFLQSYSDSTGIPMDILWGDVSAQMSTDSKNKASIDNINSEIDKRNASGTNGTGGKSYTDGSFKYSDSDVTDISTILDQGGNIDGTKYNGKGKDGYVDPDLYQALANAWVKQGGTTGGFIKKFPPANYVNPAANPNLPSYLQNKSKVTPAT